MKKGEVANQSPVTMELSSEKTYWWCACGKSGDQPFCDGSHKGTEFSPQQIDVSSTKKYYLCRCKQTSNPPYCDGSHNSI